MTELITAVQGTPFFEPPAGPVVVPLTFENNSSARNLRRGNFGRMARHQMTGNWWPAIRLQEHLNPQPAYNNDPQNQFQIHSYLNLPHHVELDGAVFYVDQINPLLGNSRARAFLRMSAWISA
jgi:hypothetical protein